MNAVVAYATCAKIWNHPDLLYNSAMKDTDDAEDFEGLDLEDFSMDGISSGPRKTKKTKKVSKISSESTEWAKNCGILQNHIPGDVMAGYKVPILLSILAKGSSPAQVLSNNYPKPNPNRIFLAAALGEKLICFSQSLGTLDVLEKFIKEDKNLPQEEPWSKRIWRIDGKSNSIDREKIIKDFSDYHQVFSIKCHQETSFDNVVTKDVSWWHLTLSEVQVDGALKLEQSETTGKTDFRALFCLFQQKQDVLESMLLQRHVWSCLMSVGTQFMTLKLFVEFIVLDKINHVIFIVLSLTVAWKGQFMSAKLRKHHYRDGLLMKKILKDSQ